MDFVTVEANEVVARGSWLEGEGDEMEDESTGAMDEEDESIEVRERKKLLSVLCGLTRFSRGVGDDGVPCFGRHKALGPSPPQHIFL